MWTHVDRGRWVKNGIFCGRHKWMAPYFHDRAGRHILYIILMAGNLRKDARRLRSDKMRLSIASNPFHVLRRLYNEKEACGYNLRTRPHNFALPVKDDTNFVSRSLYAELKS